MKLTELAGQVAAWEYDTEVDELTEQERKRVYVSLYQTHIPHLDDAGVIEYNKDTGMVMLEPDATAVDNYLETPDTEVPWQWIYLALAVVSAGALALTALDVLFFESVSDSAITVGILILFGVTAVVHTVTKLQDRQSVPSELKKRL
jgi:hypothetical protein